MAYSFTEKKRIRKDFGKLPGVMEFPIFSPSRLIRTTNSLQLDLAAEKPAGGGFACGFSVGIPDCQLLGQRGTGIC